MHKFFNALLGMVILSLNGIVRVVAGAAAAAERCQPDVKLWIEAGHQA
ncbi:MAG: hypothetical protein FWD08_04855 [Alphaproteobacteria bacterium]|nr:hypothetical protein [Alphaproteobacteria bacterium]